VAFTRSAFFSLPYLCPSAGLPAGMHDKTIVFIRFGEALHDFTLIMLCLRLSDELRHGRMQ